jgi:hypothetical protein
LDNCADSGRTAADGKRPKDGPHYDGSVSLPVEQMVCRAGHVQQLFVFGFFFWFDVAGRSLETEADVLEMVDEKQLVGRLTFGKIILGYLTRKKGEKTGMMYGSLIMHILSAAYHFVMFCMKSSM